MKALKLTFGQICSFAIGLLFTAGELNAQTNCTPTPSGIVSWWRSEGNGLDFVGTNHGVATSGVSFAPGEVGQAFSFDANSNFMTIAASGSLDVGLSGGLTVECWIKPSDLTFPQPLVEWNDGTNLGVHLWISESWWANQGGPGSVFANVTDVNGGTHALISAPDLLNTNTFQHVAVTYDKATGAGNLYLNGAVVFAVNLGNFVPGTSQQVLLGLRPTSSPYPSAYRGLLDEVGIYDRALTGLEIQAIYAAGSAGKCLTNPPPVLDPPAITGQPTNVTTAAGTTVTFSVNAVGTGPLSYQWSLNSTNLPGQTSIVLTLLNVQSSDAGLYSVTVSNAVGVATSSNAVLTVVPPPSCTPAPVGLVSLWRGEADAVDSVSANNGTLIGATTFGSGLVGQSLNFPGSSSYILVSNSPSLKFTNAMTVEAWIYPYPGINRFREIVSKWEGGGNQRSYTFNIDPSGKGAFVVSPDGVGAPSPALTTNMVPTNVWSHLAGVYDGSSLKVYLNGTLQGSVPYTGNIFPGNAQLTIGSTLIGSYFDGLIDEASLYSRALAPAEIQAIYAAGSAGKCSSNSPVAPLIISQPTNVTVFAGSSATFSVNAVGTGPLGYQWSLNSTNLPGQTGSVLTLLNVQSSDAGFYSVAVSNAVGVTTSSNAVLTVVPPLSCFPAPSGLVGAWSGEGNGNDIFLLNNGTVQSGVSFTNGVVGQAFGFNGSSGGLAISANPALDVGTGAGLTIESWINPTSVASMRPIVEWSRGTGLMPYGVHFWITVAPDGAGCLYANIVDTNTTYHGISSAGGLIQPNTFQHVAVTYDKASGVARLFLNGNVVAENNLGSFTPKTYENLYIGLRPADSLTRWLGSIDEVAIYNRALATNEINAIYIASSAGKCLTNLVPPLVAPFISKQPTNLTVLRGGTATFSVIANGTSPLSYQWRYNSTNLLGQTNNSLTLMNVQTSNAGNYSVVVSNQAGSIISSSGVLTVTQPTAVVRVLGTNTMAGNQIEVPVILVANGNENTLSFSLSYSTQRLAFAGITLGSGAANGSLLPNLSQTASGRIGVAVGLGAGETFAVGTQEVVRVLFNTTILGGSTSNNTPVNITNTPVNRLLANAGAQALSANYSNAVVTLFPTDLEGDAAPAPNGNRTLDIFDWVQVGRYVAGLETITNVNEFQRVDCAPRDTAGDGQLKVTDWVQAGRYAVALDPLTVIGGATAPVAPRPEQNSPVKLGGANREVRLAKVDSVNGLLVTVPVTLQSLGNENGLGLSLSFDVTSLRYVSATKGSSASAATLNVNTNAVGVGKLGLLLALPTGSGFASGAREIVKVTFMATTTIEGDYPIAFVDQPILRSISDATASELSSGYTSSMVTVHSNPSLIIAKTDTNVVLSWPTWASDFNLQSAGSYSEAWTNVASGVQTNGAEVSVSLPISTSSQFFRLAHP